MAARRLHVASSAVNRQILKVENELGVPLFERTPGGLRLTAAGDLLLQHVDRTLADAERVLRDIRALRHDARRQTVVIAGQESVIARFLPPALLALHAGYPHLATVFRAASGTDLIDLLASAEADIALAFDPEPGAGIEVVAERSLVVGAVMTPEHPLAGRRQVSFADCAPFPIVLPDRSWPLRERLDREIESAGLSANVVTSSNSVEFLKAMVDQRLGIGFQTVIGIEAQVERRQLVHVPVHRPEPMTQRFALCVRRAQAPSTMVGIVVEALSRRLDDYPAEAG